MEPLASGTLIKCKPKESGLLYFAEGEKKGRFYRWMVPGERFLILGSWTILDNPFHPKGALSINLLDRGGRKIIWGKIRNQWDGVVKVVEII